MNPTFAIYGIKDRFQTKYPSNVHNHNLCVMQNGKVLQYLELERYTRKKYDNRLDLIIEDLIDENLLDLPDEFDIISVNSFAGNQFISKSGRLRVETIPFKEISENINSAYSWYQTKNKGKEINAYSVSHELSHIFSNIPFFGMFKENSLLVHFDGGASLSNFSAFIFKNGKLNFVEAHWELSHLSKFFNDNALNFAILGAKHYEHTSVPGKLMGFASFGKYSEKIENWLVENDYFKDIWDNYNLFFTKAKQDFGIEISSFDTKNSFLQDIAATFQKMFEKETITKLINLQKQTKTDYLYYSGGSGLNIVTNSRIIELGIFKDVFIPPACNDSGLSLGAAAFLEWKKGNKIEKHSPYLNNLACDFSVKVGYDKKLIQETANLLLQNKIIAVANGFGEAGPRALGNRSILALANSKSFAKKVSQKCKNREWYRPVAPIMLREVAEKVIGKQIHHLSKYMLLDYVILPQYQQVLEGVTHINGTSRIQTVEHRDENPFVYDLLKYLWNEHKIYALINTSFNKKGEPIVHTKSGALQSAKNMNIDAVIIDYKLIKLKI